MQHTAAGADAFSNLVSAFRAKLSELHLTANLRVADSAKDLVLPEFESFEVNLRALEHAVEHLQQTLAADLEAVPKVRAVLEAASLQHEHLNFIQAHLPQYLPNNSHDLQSAAAESNSPNEAPDALAASQDHGSREARDAGLQHKSAPRRYITQAEFNALSAYMTSRLSLEKVNSGLEDAACLAEANLKMLTAARNNARLAAADRRRAQMLLINVAGKEQIKGKCWFTEEDRRLASVLKLDKTGRAVTTILRHLNRIQEVRITVKGTMQTIYVLT